MHLSSRLEMFSCFESRSSVQPICNTSKRKLEMKEEKFSRSVSKQLKDMMVRIVHAGGRIEMYHSPIPASELIQKYPGLCITTPDVFKSPNESVLSSHEILLPGRKYFLMRCSSLEKLKRRRAINNDPLLKSKEIEDAGLDQSISSARDFFGSRLAVSEKRPFVPPIQRPRLRKEHDWEPSLTSIQELSP